MRQFARREIHARLATVDRVIATTDVVGYLGASSIERLPVERAVSGVVREFKALRPRASAR